MLDLHNKLGKLMKERNVFIIRARAIKPNSTHSSHIDDNVLSIIPVVIVRTNNEVNMVLILCGGRRRRNNHGQGAFKAFPPSMLKIQPPAQNSPSSIHISLIIITEANNRQREHNQA